MKVLSVVGARPQFVKAWPLSRELRRDHEETLVHTGQHYDEMLSDVFFEELGIPDPDYHLGVGSGSHAVQTAEMLRGLDSLIEDIDPDGVLTYGDTNSTIAGSLAGAKRDPPVAHVEAGLRSYDREMPEEVNRVVTDTVSDLLFVPSSHARANLDAEGITSGVHVTGDVMYDALLAVRERSLDRSSILAELGLGEGDYVLATVHRARNTDQSDRLEAIVAALVEAPQNVVFPAHPRTVKALKRDGLWTVANDSLTVTEPVGYLDFIRLIDGAERVLTDSGGVQKEAFYMDTACVTLRESTEWVETVEAGWNVLVGANRAAISKAVRAPVDLPEKPVLYGDGNAAGRIVDILADAW